jgi:hypothetical protein
MYRNTSLMRRAAADCPDGMGVGVPTCGAALMQSVGVVA